MTSRVHIFFTKLFYDLCNTILRSKILKILFLTALFLSVALSAHAEQDAVTPYGDYCRECTAYGACKHPLPPHAAISAMVSYYRERGYTVGKMLHKGRFIEAEIYEGNRLVDKVLFDRKTGRVRSIL